MSRHEITGDLGGVKSNNMTAAGAFYLEELGDEKGHAGRGG